jgi:hypothetical protein
MMILSGEPGRSILGLLFADVLQEFNVKRKTGALFAVVDQSADHMARLYFEEGEILHFSFGPMKGSEFLERLDNYDFGMAVFFPGMKPPRIAHKDLPTTLNVIEAMKSTGKTIRGIHFTQRGDADRDGAA